MATGIGMNAWLAAGDRAIATATELLEQAGAERDPQGLVMGG